MVSPSVYHVTPIDTLWKVGIPGDSQPVSLHQHKKEAIAYAEQLARRHPQGQVVVHRTDGTVEEEYGLGHSSQGG